MRLRAEQGGVCVCLCMCVWRRARFAQNSGHSLNTCTSIHPYRFCVELNSTALSAISGPMSSHVRQPFLLFEFQCRVTLDRTSVVPVQMSSHGRRDLRCSSSNVESRSTALPAVPSPMSISYRRIILHCLLLIFPKLVLSNGCSWTLNIRDLM